MQGSVTELIARLAARYTKSICYIVIETQAKLVAVQFIDNLALNLSSAISE